MGSIMPICFCCKSILPVYLSCPSSTLSNIGLIPPPPRSASFLRHNKSRLYAKNVLFFLRQEASKSLASAPSRMMKWSRRCSDLPNFCHPTEFTFPCFWWYRVYDAQISTHFPLQFYDKAGSMLLKIVTLLRELESQPLFHFFTLWFFLVWRHSFLLLVAWQKICEQPREMPPLRFSSIWTLFWHV